MSYTNYGLSTGLILVGIKILVIMSYMTYVLKTRPHQKNYIITSMVLYIIFVILDTIWWIFDIKPKITFMKINDPITTQREYIFVGIFKILEEDKNNTLKRRYKRIRTTFNLKEINNFI